MRMPLNRMNICRPCWSAATAGPIWRSSEIAKTALRRLSPGLRQTILRRNCSCKTMGTGAACPAGVPQQCVVLPPTTRMRLRQA